MNEQFQERLNAAIKTIESRKQSERLLVMFMLLAGLILGYLSVAYDPLEAERVGINAQISDVNQQIQAQQSSYASMMAISQEDPARFANDRLRAIELEQQVLDGDIANLAADLITPGEMTQVLTSVLSSYRGLALISFENARATPLRTGMIDVGADESQEGSARNISGQVFSHGLTLEFQGDFFSTLQYLRFLEGISGGFFWDSISFQVAEWPNANVTLRIHTLSLVEGFIGA